MTHWEKILKAYRAGALPACSAELALACQITPENVDTIMSQLPRELLEPLSRWDSDGPAVVAGSNLSAAEEQAMQTQLSVALPALREWFQRNPKVSASSTAPALPTQEHVKG